MIVVLDDSNTTNTFYNSLLSSLNILPTNYANAVELKKLSFNLSTSDWNSSTYSQALSLILNELTNNNNFFILNSEVGEWQNPPQKIFEGNILRQLNYLYETVIVKQAIKLINQDKSENIVYIYGGIFGLIPKVSKSYIVNDPISGNPISIAIDFIAPVSYDRNVLIAMNGINVTDVFVNGTFNNDFVTDPTVNGFTQASGIWGQRANQVCGVFKTANGVSSIFSPNEIALLNSYGALDNTQVPPVRIGYSFVIVPNVITQLGAGNFSYSNAYTINVYKNNNKATVFCSIPVADISIFTGIRDGLPATSTTLDTHWNGFVQSL